MFFAINSPCGTPTEQGASSLSRDSQISPCLLSAATSFASHIQAISNAACFPRHSPIHNRSIYDPEAADILGLLVSCLGIYSYNHLHDILSQRRTSKQIGQGRYCNEQYKKQCYPRILRFHTFPVPFAAPSRHAMC